MNEKNFSLLVVKLKKTILLCRSLADGYSTTGEILPNLQVSVQDGLGESIDGNLSISKG